VTLDSALGLCLAAVLVAGGGAKLWRPRPSADALAAYGLRSPAGRRLGLAVLVFCELGLGVGVATGQAIAAYAAAAAMAAFALAIAWVLHRGGAGAPCPCFGARTGTSRRAVVGDLGLALAYAGLPSVPALRVSSTGWLAAGLFLALAGLVGLALATLGLAREIGELRLRLGPQLALELTDEGPPLGRPISLIERFPRDGDVKLAVAVFSSVGCPLCRALEPALAWLASDPFVSIVSFDEHDDADVWQALEVPGSPYALVLGATGTVLAKGAFNTGGQLEGMLATAERRAALSHADG
jgi:hypothetical protein